MTNRWKLKTSSSNILLVLILVKAEWTRGENTNSIDNTNSLDITKDESVRDQTSIYVGHDEIAQYFFTSSTNNDNTTILSGITKCLDNFQLITCMKMLLLDRINDVTGLMEEPNVRDADVQFLNGILVFKIKNETTGSGPGDISDELNLDEEITAKVKKIFWGRSLVINVLPNVQIEIEPARGKPSEFICFNYTVRRNLESTENEDNSDESEGRGRKKRRKCRPGQDGNGNMNSNMDDEGNDNGDREGNCDNGGGDRSLRKGCSGGNRGGSSGNRGGSSGNRNRGSRGGGSKGKRKGGKGGMPMMMMLPPMIMMGLMPFTLASLKAMVMNAVMVTMMALNGAIFMTVRNMVFGPRKGDNVMYVNYGYSKDKEPQTKRPVLIIHSPAAFVKQPPVPKKSFYGPYNAPQNYIQSHGDFSHNGNGNGPWQLYGSSGSSTFFRNENSGNVMTNHDTENNYIDSSDSSNFYHVEDGEIVDADVIDTRNVTSMDQYYTAPEIHNHNRKHWQGIRRTYRPKRVKHYLKIRRRTK